MRDHDETSPLSPADGRDSVPDHLVRNAHTMAEMHLRGERTVGAHQRAIESGTARLGRPGSLYVIFAIVVLWVVANALGHWLGVTVPDPPPFAWLQGSIGLAALLTATMVLITQNRHARLIERSMHLDLQVNLLTEQKTAKLIELLEELRRDMPNVPDRRDVEAEGMQRAAEPGQVVAALDEQTTKAIREFLDVPRAGHLEPGPT